MKTAICLLFLLAGHFISSAQEAPPAKEAVVINQDSVYTDVDVKASYPGGDAARIKFIEKNIDGLVPVENGAPLGTYTVVIICIIDTSGKIIATAAETNYGYGMEKEVLRIIKKIPKPYSPALKNALPVMSKVKFPVVFSISR